MELVAKGVLGLVFTASALGKVKALVTGSAHDLMGEGKPYPGFLLPVAVVHELVTVFAIYGDMPLALFLSCGFLGGVTHAQLLPNGPYAKAGPKALIPLLLAAGLTGWLLIRNHSARAPGTPKYSASILGKMQQPWVYVTATFAGLSSGAVLHALQ